jgi:hypothetical protein
MTIDVTIPMRISSIANISEHWTKERRRKQKIKDAVTPFLKPKIHLVKLPVSITLIRIAPRKLDEHDNLRMAFKTIADVIAALIFPDLTLGGGDDDDRLRWAYNQFKGKPKEYAFRIVIQNLDS